VVVDGSNLATEGRTKPSLRQLDEAVRAYAAEDPGSEIVVVVDASFEHRIDPSERQELVDAELHGEIVSPPAGAIGRGDAFVLRIAERTGARVLSNDSFQEFHQQHPWLFDEGRLVGGKPVPGIGWIFTPRIPVRGPKSRQAAGKSKRGAEALSPPVKAAELAKAAKKAAASRVMPALPSGVTPRVGDVWTALAAPPAGHELVPSRDDGRSSRRSDGKKVRREVTAKTGEEAASAKTRAGEPVTKKGTAAKQGAGKAAGEVAIGKVAKERAAKKEAAKKQAAKKQAAKKDAAKKQAAGKGSPGKKEEAAQREAAAQKAAAAQAAAQKAAPQKTAAKKAAAKKPHPASAVAEKAVTAKAAPAEAPAKEVPAKRATAKKATAKKVLGKKASAKKATAQAATATNAPNGDAIPARSAPRGPADERSPASRAVSGSRAPSREDPVVREAIDEAVAEALMPPVESVDGKDGQKRGASSARTKKAKEDGKGKRRRRRSATPPPAVNEPLAFITFVATYPLQSEVEGEVVSFTSHGAMVDVPLPGGGELHCYIPLTAMGDPPPTKARQVLSRGERRQFVLVGLDPPRRVAELALSGAPVAAGAPAATPAET
jgi:hypothetical protein